MSDNVKLTLTLFGDALLRTSAKRLSNEEIVSPTTQNLIADMKAWLASRPKYGVGLAAPQVGYGLAISVIDIKSTPYRPVKDAVHMVIINPEIITEYGRRAAMWEGCISFGTSVNDFPYAQAMRYKKIRLRYQDQQAQWHEEDFSGLLAHVMQHETDHLNGVLFVDRIKDSRTIMMKSEYLKQVKAKRK